MPAEPLIKPLDYRKRTWFFRLLFVAFALLLPLVVFYATGYRFDFSPMSPTIISTGGLYISVPAETADIYINDEAVRDIRVFRRASYIQNLSAGVHRVHVQAPGLHTWVKELPVRAHIVTEASSFNLPVVPQVRLIAPYVDPLARVGVYVGQSTTTLAAALSFATVTNQVTATTSNATSTLTANQEFEYVRVLFGTSTESAALVGRVVTTLNQTFSFPGAPTTSPATTTATTTMVERDMKLYERDGDVYATWQGNRQSIPYYFCVNHEAASSTVAQYGAHVYEGVANLLATMPMTETEDRLGRVCRDAIRIDDKGQEVKFFTFFPGAIDLVLMHLADGLYVVEIDDRAWQNVQLLYPGQDIEVAVDGGRIYVKDRTYYLEVFTVIETPR
jgi:hypothetical protein